MSNLFKILIGVFISLSLSCTDYMPVKEAERSLQVLDSKINHLLHAMDKNEFKALARISELECLPFQYDYGILKLQNAPSSSFPTERFNGTYSLNNSLTNYHFSSSLDSSITIIFPLDTLTPVNAKLKIENYKDAKWDAFQFFPTATNQKLFINDILKINIQYYGIVESRSPKSMDIQIDHEDLQLHFDMSSKISGRAGVQIASLACKHKRHTFLKATYKADIVRSSSGFYVDYLKLDGKLFKHKLSGYIDYGQINPETKTYTSSFNKNSSIFITENALNVGNIQLTSDPKTAELDLAVQFRNGQTSLLRNYLIVLDKIYKYKI